MVNEENSFQKISFNSGGFMILRIFLMAMGSLMVVLMLAALIFIYKHRNDRFTLIFHQTEEGEAR